MTLRLHRIGGVVAWGVPVGRGAREDPGDVCGFEGFVFEESVGEGVELGAVFGEGGGGAVGLLVEDAGTSSSMTWAVSSE